MKNFCEEKLTHEEKIEIWVAQIIARDFTKRQIKILGLIHLLSLHNKQFECYIPTLSTFELTGVSRHKIKIELNKLQEANILEWNQRTKIFTINTDVDTRQVPLLNENPDQKIQLLIDLNNQMIGPNA